MVKRRGLAAYILNSDGRRKKVTNHTFRATGITTQLYDRRGKNVTKSDVERIQYE